MAICLFLISNKLSYEPGYITNTTNCPIKRALQNSIRIITPKTGLCTLQIINSKRAPYYNYFDNFVRYKILILKAFDKKLNEHHKTQ